MPQNKKYNLISLVWNNLDNKVWFCTIALCSVIGAAGSSFQYFFMGELLDVMNADSFSLDQFYKPFLFVVASTIFLHIGYRMVTVSEYMSVPKMMGNVRKQLTEDTLRRSATLFTNEFSGAITSRIAQVPLSIRSITHSLQWTIIVGIIDISIILYLAYRIDWTIGALLSFWMIVNIIVTITLLRKRLRPSLVRLHKCRATFTGHVADLVSNTTITSTNDWRQSGKSSFYTSVQNEFKAYFDSRKRFNLFYIIMAVFEIVSIVGAIYLSALLVENGTLMIGAFAGITFLIIKMAGSLWALCQELGSFLDSISSINESFKFLEKYELQDLEVGDTLTLKKAPSLTFKNVDFAYGKSSEGLFDNFNLKIKSGEKVALIGHSGAGKTSLVNLVLSFYDPASGELQINRKNINTYSKNSYRQHISVISQDTSLFHQSVRDNIAYGMPNATDEDIINAAKQAYAHDFISKLENGYDSMVGDRGVQLSGGQRQRIAIARAILKNSPIFILDEATSALDSQSEKYIQDSLKEVMKNKTVIAIAHRLSTISEMDRIIVLDAGKIVEEGSHEALLKKGGSYAKMWAMQSGGFLQE